MILKEGFPTFNDTWSNIHFGYIGRVAAFSIGELLKGAALARAGNDILDSLMEKFIKVNNQF